jgi:NADH-quinone oxidoreductase subunit J
MEFIFYLSAAVAVLATLRVIAHTQGVHALLYLTVSFLAIALCFFLLGAPFIGALEVIIYAGAIMVLFVFVIMLLNVRAEETRMDKQKYLKWLAAPLFLALLAEVMAVVRYVNLTPQPLPSANGAANPQGVLGTVENIAFGMFTDYLIPFEAASILILMAIVGSMLLARREQKEDVERIEKALIAQQEEEQKYEEEVAV